MMRHWIAILILILAIPANAEKWALLVGVNQYQSHEISPLKYAVADVKAVANALKAAGNFPADNVFVMTDAGSARDLATGTNIIWRLSWLAKNMAKGDTLVFYFSGHGLEKDGNTYLLSFDSDIANSVTLKRSAIRMAEIQELVKIMPASRVISFMDACRNDPTGGKSVGGTNALTKGMARDLTLVSSNSAVESRMNATFFSCSPGERSWEFEKTRQGFFSYYLVKGLFGEAASKGGKITINSLESYLAQQVPKAVNRELGYKQVPWVRREGAGGGDVVLAMARQGKPQVLAAGQSSGSLSPNPPKEPGNKVEEVAPVVAATGTVIEKPAEPVPPPPPHPARGYEPVVFSKKITDYDLAFSLTKGNYWKYRTGPGIETRTIVDSSENRGRSSSKLLVKTEYGQYSSKLAWTDDGWLVQDKAQVPSGSAKTKGVKRIVSTGDSWKTKVGTYRVESLDTVKTKAGEFQAVRIRCDYSNRSLGTYTAWYAQGIGLVKYECDYFAGLLVDYRVR